MNNNQNHGHGNQGDTIILLHRPAYRYIVAYHQEPHNASGCVDNSNKPQMDEQAKKYIDSQSSSFYNTLLKRCMGRGHKKTKYLFNPRITEEWREGGTLVVGINHWCTQEMCEHYADCVLNSNSRKTAKWVSTCLFRLPSLMLRSLCRRKQALWNRCLAT